MIGIRQPVDLLPVSQQAQSNMNNPRPSNFVPTLRQQPQMLKTMQ